MNIVLTGFMASGKTTIGKRISELCGYEFVDTDEMTEEIAKKSINEIFASEGEEYFRQLESDVIARAATADKTVISTGGGVVLRAENIEELRKTGRVFFLNADFSVIESRVLNAMASRPLMRGQSMEEIKKRYADRMPYYNNCDVKIHITEETTPDDAAKEILRHMNLWDMCDK